MTTVDLQYSGADSIAIARFDDILEQYLGSKNTVMSMLDDLISTNPEMPMAHLFRAYLLKLASDPRFIGPAKSSLTNAKQLSLNTREQHHAAALDAWFEGDSLKTTAILEQSLKEYPLDILALKIAHHLHFYSGDAKQMRDSVARVVNQFYPGHRFQGYVLGMHSFGLEEAGSYVEAEKFGRMAVELNPDDQWAAHAVTHVMQMQGRTNEGIDWTANLIPKWQDSNNFIYHVHWHQALFYLGEHNLDAALHIYDTALTRPLIDDFYLDVCNAASLLWRVEMLGGNVGDRWQALQTYSARVTDDELIFCTLHYLMAPARLQDEVSIKKALSHLADWQEKNTTQANIVSEIGAPLAQAICDLGAGQYKRAAATFESVSPNLFKIGGSHAQRHLFDDMRQFATLKATA